MQALLERRRPCRSTLLGMTTRGDQILDRSLSKVGGKGLFVKELEIALEEGRADLAVHSLKDVPMDLPAGFALAACWSAKTRAMPSSPTAYASLDELPQGAVVGTSSLRRVVLLRALRPDLRIEPLRGNLDTRLRKLDEGAVRRHRAGRRRPASGWAWRRASAPASSPRRCCRRPGRARWASRCAPTPPTSASGWRR